MGWSFRRTIKIVPGVRINLSKSGISTSIGGKGLTYNTRGRLTTSIPGTGIRHTQNLNARRTARPIRSAVSASQHIDSASTDRLSKREQVTRDFVTQVQNRTTKALRQYFISHGAYVVAENLADAVTLEDHQEFLGSLTREFEVTTKAIKLAVDIGTISLVEKEKAMIALYEIERKCEDHQGDRSELDEAATSLWNKVLAWPISPSFFWPFLLSLLGCLFLLMGNFTFGPTLIVGSALYGIYKLKSFEKKKVSVLAEITEANTKFDSLVTNEISPRPVVPNSKDTVHIKALMLAGITVVLALIVVVYRPQDIGRAALISSENSNPVDKNVRDDNKPTLQISASVPVKSSTPHRSQIDFKWLIGKYPSDVVNDRRFRAAFNDVSPNEWRKIADRLAVTNADGIQSKDGYYFGDGCKAHFCDSDNAAFAINEATGKGDVIYKESSDFTSNKMVANGFVWSDTPIASTPLVAWANSNGMKISTAEAIGSDSTPHPTLQTSFDCTKARSDAERLICGDRELAADDLELASVFAKAKAAVTDQVSFKERTRKAWNYRERNCHNRDCIVSWYASQKATLRQIVETGSN
ncbi:DUF4236 domain-containing protein [Glaciimonas soli]|uniref:DUF4236 domain-containing protein n=1 Tax=Glaciimonas soli TaxID=2590999 RepID=A0A843YUE1_9BURK|nr:DUF4236 domain-containing protein [Glaciimonas soli]MQR01118.1 DUF4236 domain-containing protein [Glaciimonas soli]